VSTESHRSRGRTSVDSSLMRCINDVARHPFRWLLISLRSINRHRAPVSVAVAAAAATFGAIYTRASESEASCERSNTRTAFAGFEEMRMRAVERHARGITFAEAPRHVCVEARNKPSPRRIECDIRAVAKSLNGRD